MVLVAAAAILWLPQLPSSLWHDEAGTYWTAKGGFSETVDRVIRYQGQSPLYYMVVWVTLKLGGAREIVLRLPSVLSMALAAVLLFRLGRDLVDEETGWLATIFFVSSADVRYFSGEARPYALALAIAVAATLALVRWLGSGRKRDAIVYAALAALVVYAHYLFGIVLLCHAAYALRRTLIERKVPLGMLVTVTLLTAVLLLPLSWQFLSLWQRRSTLVYMSGVPSVDALLTVLAQPATVVTLLSSLLLARILSPSIGLCATRARPGSLLLLASWYILPPLLLFVLATRTPVHLFVARYYFLNVPALALLIAWLLRTVKPRRARLLVALVPLALSLATYWDNGTHLGSFRDLVSIVRMAANDSDMPVLIWSPLVEGNQVEWLRDPERKSYLLALADFYGFNRNVTALPNDISSPTSQTYLDSIKADFLTEDRPRLLLLGPPSSEAWVAKHLAPRPFVSRRLGGMDWVATLFERR
ncbi:MAG TPA: glycosyltransferase family 39 protein [Candidatus Methylomirabilis sp.]|nr:glycosyltransferase family 39 protein [Candidatus Methylomirabilis sp.]